MFKIVLATKNLNKKREIEEIIRLKDIYPVKSPEISLEGAGKPLFNGVRFLSLAHYPSFPEIEEDGKNFRENAIKKALATANFTQELALADDSGLEVEVLKGEPGIHSARFAGEKKDDRANIKKLLELLNAELDPQVKNRISHRAKAIEKINQSLQNVKLALRNAK
ncbi:MAG: hypothetical protein B5M48_04290 [Candidatus Omnitrophica bacterium 4484_213]|nr:MAG: hypothetical protein B5M48_04290 [Candidatus Omnitrophica bacterium 4484_213]